MAKIQFCLFQLLMFLLLKMFFYLSSFLFSDFIFSLSCFLVPYPMLTTAAYPFRFSRILLSLPLGLLQTCFFGLPLPSLTSLFPVRLKNFFTILHFFSGFIYNINSILEDSSISISDFCCSFKVCCSLTS